MLSNQRGAGQRRSGKSLAAPARGRRLSAVIPASLCYARGAFLWPATKAASSYTPSSAQGPIQSLGLTCLQEQRFVEVLLAVEHVVDATPELVAEYAEGFSFAVLVREAVFVVFDGL